jgi:hypothetical protein
LPTLILLLLKRGVAKNMFLFSFSLGLPFGLYLQIIAERNNVWKYVPIIPFFHIKDIPLEALLWYPSWFGLVIATYLFFFDQHSHKLKFKTLIPKHLRYFGFCSFLCLISIVLLLINEHYSQFPYAYIFLISPLVLFSLFLFKDKKFGHFVKIFFPTTLILFLPMLVYDLLGVSTHQWIFPGQYLYNLNFGLARLPVEEFVMWLWVGPASVIAYFEEFESNFK